MERFLVRHRAKTTGSTHLTSGEGVGSVVVEGEGGEDGEALHIEYPGAFYHMTARGNERKDVFRSQPGLARSSPQIYCLPFPPILGIQRGTRK